ncbi:MAG TPA: hypothetical protein DCE71_08460 [Parachlamydiales bacterium]|nr:hypothetical protein [Parachlamydiales bacterium]
MIFERIGFFFFSKVRPLFTFLMISSPLLCTGLYVVQKRLERNELQTQYETTLLKTYKSLNKRADQHRFLSRYAEAEPYFIDQHIESLPLLQEEIDWLQTYEHHPALAETKLAKQRLAYLSKEKNKISFIEEEIKKSALCQETEEKMKKPVEMSEKDLKKLLSLIENIHIGPFEPHPKSPQMIITNFSLKKKTSPFKQETFEVKLDLLKREFKKQ